MPNLPREIRKQIKSFISKTTNEALDLVINLAGKYIDEKKREKLKKKAQLEMGTKIEKAIANTYQMGLKLREEYRQQELDASSLKERFYLMTDTVFQSMMPEIPKNVHAMDYLFQICEELLRDFRFDWRYLRDTKYTEYLQSLKTLMAELKREQKMSKAWDVINEFKNSQDFYPLIQATLQRLIKHYEFLARDFPKIEKKQIDKYLEIYEELSGHYEKFISLLVALIQLTGTNNEISYEDARKRGLYQNIRFIEKSGWEIFVSGFNRKIRNAIVHKTCKVDILKEIVEFVDRNKTITLTFQEIQKETRVLAALLLILPHALISIFCLAVLSLREMLDNLPDQINAEA